MSSTPISRIFMKLCIQQYYSKWFIKKDNIFRVYFMKINPVFCFHPDLLLIHNFMYYFRELYLNLLIVITNISFFIVPGNEFEFCLFSIEHNLYNNSICIFLYIHFLNWCNGIGLFMDVIRNKLDCLVEVKLFCWGN